MSARALTAVAALTAALAGPVRQATAQPLSDAQPAPPAGSTVGVSHVGGPAPPAGTNPFLGGMPTTDPAVMPVVGGHGGAALPGYPVGPAYPVTTPGPVIATDTFVGAGAPRGPQWWLGAEYLVWWTKDFPVPVPIATVGPAGSTALFGAPGTQVIIGGSNFDFDAFSGVRVIGGIWLTGNESIGVEGSIFILPTKSFSTPSIVGTDVLPVLARPFFDTTLQTQNSRLLTSPGLFAGGVRAEAEAELWGADLNAVWRAIDNGGWWTVDTTAGFKFLSLEESLTINDFSSALAGGVAVWAGRGFTQPATTFVTDEFKTTNRFYGGSVGIRANAHVEAFTWSTGVKFGFGNMRQTLRVNGTSTLAGGGFASPVTIGGGFFGTGAGTGKVSRDEFAFVPELATNLSVQVTRSLMLTVGYTFLWVSDVARPGDQINFAVNPTLVPTSQNFGANFGPRPPLSIRSTEYWAQGFNFGLSLAY